MQPEDIDDHPSRKYQRLGRNQIAATKTSAMQGPIKATMRNEYPYICVSTHIPHRPPVSASANPHLFLSSGSQVSQDHPGSQRLLSTPRTSSNITLRQDFPFSRIAGTTTVLNVHRQSNADAPEAQNDPSVRSNPQPAHTYCTGAIRNPSAAQVPVLDLHQVLQQSKHAKRPAKSLPRLPLDVQALKRHHLTMAKIRLIPSLSTQEPLYNFRCRGSPARTQRRSASLLQVVFRIGANDQVKACATPPCA